MADVKYAPTADQKLAIDTRDRDLLVSAAAGSGKTATLTDRVIASLLDEAPERRADLSRLLIVTFTRSAARLMRTRIAAALTEAIAADPHNDYLARQLSLLGGARISTIDSFYLDVVRANAEAAGLSPTLKPVDTHELYAMRRDTMNAVIDEMYAAAGKGFKALTYLLGNTRRQGQLTETLLTVYDNLRRLPGGLLVLDYSIGEANRMQTAPYETEAGKLFLKTARAYAERAVEMGRRGLALLPDEIGDCMTIYTPMFEGEIQCGERLLAALSGGIPDAVCAALAEPLPEKSRKRPQKSPQLTAILQEYTAFAKARQTFTDTFNSYDRAEIAKGAAAGTELLTALKETLQAFDRRYNEAKAEREVAEFSDIADAAHRLLVRPDGSPTEIAAAMQAEFDAIYIDEFQDTDRRQDDIFRVLSNGKNRFLVGDVKQSIYRFRGADADVFNDYRNKFAPVDQAAAGVGATVFMSECFRCNRPVIDFSNAVSGYLFPRMAANMNYTEKDDLKFAKKGLPEGYEPPKCRLSLLSSQTNDEKATNAVEDPEAHLIALEIDRLLKEGKKIDGSKLERRDIAVLSRKEKPLQAVAEVLTAMDIPVNDTTKKDPFENPDVLCVVSLLSVIDNPHKDIHLAAVLRSPLFGFSLSELVTVRSAADRSLSLFEALNKAAEKPDDALAARCRRFLAQLSAFREKARQLPVDKLLRYLYRDTLLYGFTHGDAAQKNYARRNSLQRLYEYARRFEAGGFRGLFQFIRYIEGVMESGQTVKEDHAATDAVTLSTVHGAKGLEYPVCLLIDTGDVLRHEDLNRSWLIDKKTGFTSCIPNDGPFSQAETFAHIAAAYAYRRADLEEEARILYVAMTRAKEQLIVTGAMTKSLQDRLSENRDLDPLTDGAHSYLKWIALALGDLSSKPYCDVVFTDPATLKPVAAAHQAADAEKDAAPSPETVKTLQERFAYVYPYEHLTRLPAKLSVSRLSPTVLDVYDGDAATTEQEDVDRLLRTFEKKPLFGADKEADAAERGTATHEFLQFCDFARAENEGVAAEIDRLIAAGYLPDTAKKEVFVEELTAFFGSRFYADLRDAREVHRETRFNIFLPARDFTENADFKAAVGDEKLLVQGVIDLFFTDKNGKLVLCDYKTDRLKTNDPQKAAAFLFERHGEQLHYYKEALHALCGRYPDRVLIYSLPLGEAVAEP